MTDLPHSTASNQNGHLRPAAGRLARYRIIRYALPLLILAGGCAYEQADSFHSFEDMRKTTYRIEQVSPHSLHDVTACMAEALRGHATASNQHPHATIHVETSAVIDTIALEAGGAAINERYPEERTLLYLIENRVNRTTGITYQLWVNPLIDLPGPKVVLEEVNGLVRHCL